MARSGPAMPSTARRQPSDADLHARLSARIEALEDRIRRLEAHVRRALASRPAPQVKRATRGAEPVKAGPSRPRCPGCTLELPRGARGESCVWCGFHFEAVRRGRGNTKR